MKRIFSILALFCAVNLYAAAPTATVTNVARAVQVNTNAHLIFPTNFWLSNFTAGSGISFSGTTNLTITANPVSTFQNATVSNLLNVSNLTTLGAVFTNGSTNYGRATFSNIFSLGISVTNGMTNYGIYYGDGSGLTTVNAATLQGLGTNVLTDTNVFRQSTNYLYQPVTAQDMAQRTGLVNSAVISYRHTNGTQTAGAAGFTNYIDMRHGGEPYVSFFVTTNFTIFPTNLPLITNIVTSVNVRLMNGSGSTWVMTVPPSMTNRYGGFYSNAFAISNGAVCTMSISAYGNPAALQSLSNCVWSFAAPY